MIYLTPYPIRAILDDDIRYFVQLYAIRYKIYPSYCVCVLRKNTMTTGSHSVAGQAPFASDEVMTFTIAGESHSAFVTSFAERLRDVIVSKGNIYRPNVIDASGEVKDEMPLRLVLNMCDVDAPRPVKRRGQGTFVASIFEGPGNEASVMHAAYPLLIRSISNLIIYNTIMNGMRESHFITPEQGHYVVRHDSDDATNYERLYERVQPLACSHLVINNDFVPDLPEAMWEGEEPVWQVCKAGVRLDQMGLLPSPTRIEDFLTENDLRMVRRLYNIGGLSYGNLSARAQHNPEHFWMSASGVDKSNLKTVGRDVLLVTGYVPEQLMIRLSVPPHVEPRRVSVDAIEHWMIYREHPSVGAIVHIHAWWSDPIESTQVNYPCGTYEIAAEVAELVRRAPDPSRAVIGLKNHGLTITGHSIEEIFARIEGKIVPQVPMN